MNLFGFVVVFVVLKFILTWIAIISLVLLIAPDTAWQFRVLWQRWRGTLDHIPSQPPTWKRTVRLSSLIALPCCLILLALFAQALLPAIT
ncbi:MAG: hypothetical protein ACFE0Q_19560 [Anaerolineae bacterium]